MHTVKEEVKRMPDYRKMYLKMAQETEKAIRILIAAQKECEELYIEGERREPILLSPKKEKT